MDITQEESQRLQDLLRQAAEMLTPRRQSETTSSLTRNEAATMTTSVSESILSRVGMSSPRSFGSNLPIVTVPREISPRDSVSSLTAAPDRHTPYRFNRQGEMRGLFSPYASATASSGAGRSANRMRGTSTPPDPKEWVQKFFCLGDAASSHSPLSHVKTYLQELGLGEKTIILYKSTTSAELREKLKSTYNKLQGTDFELLKQIGGGGCGKPLYPVIHNEKIPSVQNLLAAGVRKNLLIYIRPQTNLVYNMGYEFDEQESTVRRHNSATNIRSHRTSTVTRADDSLELSDETASVTSDGDASIAASTTQCLASASSIVARDQGVPASSSTFTEEVEQLNRESPNDNFGTVAEFQLEYFRNVSPNDSQRISVSRRTLLNEVIHLYTHGSVDLKRKVDISFLGEDGIDCGGLTKEFFFKTLVDAVNGPFEIRHSIFTGETDHKFPSNDPILLRNGVYKAIGRLMCHSFLCTGIAAFGLSKSIIYYLCSREVDNTKIPFTFEDLSSVEYRQGVTALDEWTEERDMTQEEKDGLKSIMVEVGFNTELTQANKNLLKDIIFFHNIISVRKCQLDEMKIAFVSTGINDFLIDRTHLWPLVFPVFSSATQTAVGVMDFLEFSGSNEETVKLIFQQFLNDLEASGNLTQFMWCVSGQPILVDKIVVKIGNYSRMSISTCFNQIEIPGSMTSTTIIECLHGAVFDGRFTVA